GAHDVASGDEGGGLLDDGKVVAAAHGCSFVFWCEPRRSARIARGNVIGSLRCRAGPEAAARWPRAVEPAQSLRSNPTPASHSELASSRSRLPWGSTASSALSATP